jgi:WD40 repeat protein
VTSVAFSRDSRCLATTSPDQPAVIVWDVAGARAIRTWNSRALKVALGPHGKWVAGGGGDPLHTDRPGFLRIWDVDSGEEKTALLGPQPSRIITGLALSPDGKRLAAASGDYKKGKLADQAGEVRVWDVTTGKQTALLPLKAGYASDITFSPDGRSLALAISDRTVLVWAVKGKEATRIFHGHTDYVKSVAFDPAGERLAAGGANGVVVIWNARNGGEILRLQADSRAISGLAFSPDGDRLATASFGLNANGTLKIWDGHSGREILILPGQTCVAFSPDGHDLAAGGAGDAWQAGGVKVWKAKPR